MNTENKPNVFHDAFKGASKELLHLISLVVGNGQMHSELSTAVEFDEVEGKEFTVRCYDKQAVGVSTCGTIMVIVTYPSKFDITVEQMRECLEYRGVKHAINAHETYYRAMTSITDVMMRFGKVVYIHHVK